MRPLILITTIIALVVPARIACCQEACDASGISLLSWLHPKKHACCNCGCEHGCRKVCKLVEDEREVTTTCWGIATEEFCVPSAGHVGCKHCEEVCGDCVANDKENVSAKPKKLVWYDWLPSKCAELKTRKKLVKQEVTKKVVGYKWKVVDLCESCLAGEKPVEIKSDANVPNPPKTADALILTPTVIQ